MKRSGSGLAIAALSGGWAPDSRSSDPTEAQSVTERFGVSTEDMRKILAAALSKGGDFAELFFEYRIAGTLRMEEDIVKESTRAIQLGMGVRVIKDDQTGY